MEQTTEEITYTKNPALRAFNGMLKKAKAGYMSHISGCCRAKGSLPNPIESRQGGSITDVRIVNGLTFVVFKETPEAEDEVEVPMQKVMVDDLKRIAGEIRAPDTRN